MVQITGNRGKRAPRGAAPAARVHRILEDVLGCKWTLHVLGRIRAGIHRPGAIARSTEGLSTKVLNERLSKLVRFGVLEKRSFAEIPPRVEYHLTALGGRISGILGEVEKLQQELESRPPARRGRPAS